MSMYRIDREPAPLIGFYCSGGGASINDSPLTVNINLTINVTEGISLVDHAGNPTEAAKTLGFLEKILQRGADRRCDGGRLQGGAGRSDFAIGIDDKVMQSLLSEATP